MVIALLPKLLNRRSAGEWVLVSIYIYIYIDMRGRRFFSSKCFQGGSNYCLSVSLSVCIDLSVHPYIYIYDILFYLINFDKDIFLSFY